MLAMVVEILVGIDNYGNPVFAIYRIHISHVVPFFIVHLSSLDGFLHPYPEDWVGVQSYFR